METNNTNNNQEIKDGEVQETQEELRMEDMQYLQCRTAQLFEIISMCEGNEEQMQLCRNEIIELNIRLVPHILKKYKPFGDDEFQMGCLGLILATRSFEPARNVPFASYACFCIERELHKAHRNTSSSFEYMLGNNLSSLDAVLAFKNGDEADKYDTIADDDAEGAFDKVLEDNDLSGFFSSIIMPAIDEVSTKTKGQASTVDFEVWKQLELKYILEMAEVDSQKARVTLSAIAKKLGVSTQNIRMRHQRVIESIKSKCIENEIGL